MNFGEIVPEFFSDKEVKFVYTDMDREWENRYYTAIGWATAFIGMCLDKKVNYGYLNKSWKNEGWTIVKYYWNS